MKELTESVAVSTFRNQFETSRSFDLEDDMEFCPKLLTESDVSVECPRSSSPDYSARVRGSSRVGG